MWKKLLLVFILMVIAAIGFAILSPNTDEAAKYTAQADQAATNIMSIVDEAVRIQKIPKNETVTVYIDPKDNHDNTFNIVLPIVISDDGYTDAHEKLKKAFINNRNQYHMWNISIVNAYVTYMGNTIVSIQKTIIKYAEPISDNTKQKSINPDSSETKESDNVTYKTQPKQPGSSENKKINNIIHETHLRQPDSSETSKGKIYLSFPDTRPNSIIQQTNKTT